MPIPGDLSRRTCGCKHKCIARVMKQAEGMVYDLRGEVRDTAFLLELVKHSQKML